MIKQKIYNYFRNILNTYLILWETLLINAYTYLQNVFLIVKYCSYSSINNIKTNFAHFSLSITQLFKISKSK